MLSSSGLFWKYAAFVLGHKSLPFEQEVKFNSNIETTDLITGSISLPRLNLPASDGVLMQIEDYTTNPTLGDGTIRAIIYYKLRTFGE